MKSFPLDLGKRERQIVEAVYRLGEASVSEVLEELPDPPSYSSVRAMLGLLVEKQQLKFRQDGKRYLYRPAVSKEKVRRSVLRNLLSTFFAGEPIDAMAALLDVSANDLTDDQLKQMKQLIDKARREN
ncbi:BlaI/MecI/CopY family transcriptional regulator [Planctomycetota bacterium]